MRTYLSNRLAICPKRRQLGCRATAQSHCRLCKPHRRASFDHLVGAGEQRGRYIDAKRPGGLQIDDELELGRRLYWQVARLLTPEDTVDVAGRAPVEID